MQAVNENMQVCWRIDNIDYVLMRVRPDELRTARKNIPNMVTRPCMYAMLENGDVEWWPDCMEGWPVIDGRMMTKITWIPPQDSYFGFGTR